LSDDFNAETLVKGNLDSIYHNVHAEEYVAMCETTTEECIADYEEAIQIEVDYFIYYFEFDETMITDSTHERITNLYKKIYDHSKYEIGSVSEAGDNYSVSVTIYPIDIIDKLLTDDYDDFYLSYEEKYNNGDSAEELEEYWQNGILEMMESHLNSIDYLDSVTLSVQVIPVEETTDTVYYAIDDNDFATINEYIIAY
jgi:hypothetical protein